MWTLLKSCVRRNSSYNSFSLYKCHCGTEKIIVDTSVKNGQSKSCGCIGKDQLKIKRIAAKEAKTTHAMTHTREYSSWKSMKQRCCNANNKAYHNYGGRGIKIDCK